MLLELNVEQTGPEKRVRNVETLAAFSLSPVSGRGFRQPRSGKRGLQIFSNSAALSGERAGRLRAKATNTFHGPFQNAKQCAWLSL